MNLLIARLSTNPLTADSAVLVQLQTQVKSGQEIDSALHAIEERSALGMFVDQSMQVLAKYQMGQMKNVIKECTSIKLFPRASVKMVDLGMRDLSLNT